MLRKLRRPSPALFIAVIALVVAATGVGIAAIPSSDGTVSACYVVKGGQVRVIDVQQGQTCARGEKPLTWNQIGPPGAKGDTGAQGLPGVNGTTKVVVRAGTAVDLPPSGAAAAVASCNPGEIAVGGGGHSLGDGIPQSVSIYGTQPALDGVPDLAGGETANGWRVDAQNNSQYHTQLAAYVMCASP